MMSQMDINEILGSIMSEGPILSTHKGRIETIMRHFAAAGLPLETCADGRHLSRSVSTLKGYAREFSLRFSDYTPQALMSDEELKASRKRRPRNG